MNQIDIEIEIKFPSAKELQDKLISNKIQKERKIILGQRRIIQHNLACIQFSNRVEFNLDQDMLPSIKEELENLGYKVHKTGVREYRISFPEKS